MNLFKLISIRYLVTSFSFKLPFSRYILYCYDNMLFYNYYLVLRDLKVFFKYISSVFPNVYILNTFCFLNNVVKRYSVKLGFSYLNSSYVCGMYTNSFNSFSYSSFSDFINRGAVVSGGLGHCDSFVGTFSSSRTGIFSNRFSKNMFIYMGNADISKLLLEIGSYSMSRALITNLPFIGDCFNYVILLNVYSILAVKYLFKQFVYIYRFNNVSVLVSRSLNCNLLCKYNRYNGLLIFYDSSNDFVSKRYFNYKLNLMVFSCDFKFCIFKLINFYRFLFILYVVVDRLFDLVVYKCNFVFMFVFNVFSCSLFLNYVYILSVFVGYFFTNVLFFNNLLFLSWLFGFQYGVVKPFVVSVF